MSESLTISGVIEVINDTQTFKNEFTKKTFVIKTMDEKYPQSVILETIKDKTSLLGGLRIGDAVEVKFNIRGNNYEGKYFNNLQVWELNKLITPEGSENSSKKIQKVQESEDDLPF